MSYQYNLSLLICHLPDRIDYLMRLLHKIDEYGGVRPDIEILIDDDTELTTGAKRNKLLQKASGKYLAFIDDDDLITEHYFPGVFEGIKKGVDCCSLKGIITDDGRNPRTFIHSLKYDHWFEEGGVYYRNPNHLSTVRSDLARQIDFPGKNVGEDHDWSKLMHRSGLLKTEHWIEEPIYLYLCRSKK